MKQLAEYMYKDVKVKTDDGQIFLGTVESWDCEVTNKEDYDREEDSIDVRKGGTSTKLFQSEIVSIEEI